MPVAVESDLEIRRVGLDGHRSSKEPMWKGANSTRSVQLLPTASVVVDWQSPGANDDRANSGSEKVIAVNVTGRMPVFVIVVAAGARSPRWCRTARDRARRARREERR